MELRRYHPSDTEEIAQLFHDAVRSVNSNDYSEEQVKAWAPDNIHFRDWEMACSTKFTLVAEMEKITVGFAQLEDDGHIDCFYCHKNFQRQGVGRLLLDGIEKEARRRNHTRVYAEVSITAKPFFEKMRFSFIKEQSVLTRGVELTNFRMEKYL